MRDDISDMTASFPILHPSFWLPRLALLALPWQIRWFSDTALAGWSWEQGRVSVYVSWAVLIGFVLFGRGAINRAPVSVAGSLKSVMKHAPTYAIFLLIISSLISLFISPGSLRPILQWWLQIAVLAAFVMTLIRVRLPARTLAVWFVVSLLPHVVLGYWQYAIQEVIGSRWLGMAAQLPENLGVSVVEHGAYRVLRMYGGFPHPNIFGGWIAIGLLVSLWLAATSETKSRALLWSLASAFISLALLLSYARGAWLAALVGVALLLCVGAGSSRPGRGNRAPASRQFFFIALFASLVAVGILGYSQRDHLAARFDRSQRLEAKSLDMRVASLQTGWDLFRRNILIGTGPNAELLSLATEQKTRTPLEPPHNIYLLALVNFGLIGSAALLYLALLFLRGAWRSTAREIALPTIAVLLGIGLFDHYLWSTWSGQALVAFTLLLTASKGLGNIPPES